MTGAPRSSETPTGAEGQLRTLDRRTFLKRAAQVAAGSAFVGLTGGVIGPKVIDRLRRPWEERAFPPPGSPRVAVVRAASYEGISRGS